jgi:ABC-type bacteriocin/lantibiotic exporter with double-glycine peptidase domain
MSTFDFAVLSEIFSLLPKRRKRELVLLLAGGVIQALVEMASVASLALIASVISNPKAILESGPLAMFASIQGFLAGLQHHTLIVLVATLALLLMVLKNALGAGIVYANATVGSLIDAYFGDLLLTQILAKPYVWFLRQNTVDLFTLVGWRRHVGSGILFMTMQTLCDAMIISIMLCGILVTFPLISAMLLVGSAVAGWGVLRLFRAVSVRVGTLLKGLESLVNRRLTMTLRGAKDIKIFGLEDSFRKHFNVESHRYARCEGEYRLLARLPSMFFEVLGFAILFGAIAVFLLLNKDASGGSILGFLTLLTVAAWRILNAVNRVLSSVSAIRLDIPPARKVLELIGEDIPTPISNNRTLTFAREIRLDKISFRYPEARHPALKDVSLFISKGLCLGLVGRSGAGKSTLADILIGLLRPECGAMTVDGTTVNEANASAWMLGIGYVGQNPHLLDATLQDNIAFGVAPEAVDRNWALECCRLAHIDGFLQELPRGLDSPLGEGGGNLSGGQRQRVAIARALYRRPEVLILDEATSALDIQSENFLRNTIQELAGNFTVVIIAHRLSTVENCHAVAWLEQGEVKAFGPTSEILDRYRQCMHEADSEELVQPTLSEDGIN